MIVHVEKRDGRIAKFNSYYILEAVRKAFQATKFSVEDCILRAQKIELAVVDFIHNYPKDTIHVETIQDEVEAQLMKDGAYETAKAYIIYREKRDKVRKLKEKCTVGVLEEYLEGSNWRIKENSNQGWSLQGLNNHIFSEITSEYWLNKIYSKQVRDAHVQGDMHIHDLNLLAVYCVGWDLQDLIKVGFKGVCGNIECEPAKHFSSILGQLCNFFFTLQGEAAGAQAVSSFDTLLAPFIRYDKLTYKQVKHSMQNFIFNMNIPTRVGFQTPFTNITMDMKVPSTLAKLPVIIGGKEWKEHENESPKTYADFQHEMDMINRAFCEVMSAGDAKGRVFTFPIPTYNITKDFDWNNEKYDPIWKMTGKYGIPYFSNFVNSDMSPEDTRSMCCRLRLDSSQLQRRGGGLFGANPLTGSIGVVTINLPRIGHAESTEEGFFDHLNSVMQVAKESLVVKRKALENFSDMNLYPYSNFYLRNVKLRFNKYWSNHFSTIGLLGMNEACLNFLGKEISTHEGRDFSIKVLKYMREVLQQYQEETGDFFNLEATPAEGTSYRLAKLDHAKYSDIIFANGESKDNKVSYYTNSSQLPVGHTKDLFEALDIQDELQIQYTGGTVFHGFIGESVEDAKTVKKLIRTVTNNYKLPYFTMSPTFSICSEHGYLKGEQPICPKCAVETEVYSRVVGYLRPVNRWNDGKLQEWEEREEFVI